MGSVSQPTNGTKGYNWLPIIIQTIVLLGALIGFAIANEHRLTTLETDGRETTRRLQEVCATVQNVQSNQIKVLLMIDNIEKRHAREDREEARRNRY